MGIFWGGGETFDYNIAQNLAAMDHKVTILTGKPLFSPQTNIIQNIETNYLSTPYLRKFSYQLTNKIPKMQAIFLLLDLYLFEKSAFGWIKKHQSEFDVVHILGMTLLAKETVREFKKPTILWYPGPPSERWEMRDIKELNGNRLLKFFAHGDTVSYLRNKNIEINDITPGVQVDLFKKTDTEIRKNYGISEDEILLLSCGRIIPGKGFEFLINGFKRVSEQSLNVKLLIVGDGPLRPSLEKLANRLGLEDKIIFIGKVEYKDLPAYYSAADIFLLLSSYENFSNSVLEAMSCELPIIVTNLGGFPLQIKDSVNGFLVNYLDIESLTQKILYLVQHPDIREKMGRINRQEILENYDWENSVKKLLALCNKVIFNRKTKVIFIIPNLGKGGAERVLVNLLENLDRNKIEPFCIFYDSKHVYPIPEDVKNFNLNLPGTQNFFKKIYRNLLRVLKIAIIIRREKPDTIFSFMNKVNLAVIISKILSRDDAKLIISERNTPYFQLSDKMGSLVKFLMKIFYFKADMIIAVSKGVKKDLVFNFNITEDKIKVIYNPLDIEKIQKLAKDNVTEHTWFLENIPMLINVASLTEKKGQQYLLSAFKILREKVRCRLVILGDGENENKLKKLAIDLGIEEDVAFLEFQMNPFKFMARASVFILSSLWEGFPNVIIEAMACGVPVISTDCHSGPNEIIDEGINGILVPPKDEKKLADAILAILRDKKLAEGFSLSGLKKIKDFSLNEIIMEYTHVLTIN
jgi:glycosyltransferase involved in cell wall biosynthesis